MGVSASAGRRRGPGCEPRRAGKVYIVGAGPGDPGLITRRGLACLRQADVVVYDRLVAPALLTEAPWHAERICAAKSSGRHRLAQRAIEALLVARAREGKTVVRLKGGDPFVFGRGGEEALALHEAGVEFEVVPGVTSATAVPAAAGIPVTHREVAAGFAVWTAHRCMDPQIQPIDAPTQVILMGSSTLAETAEALIRRGKEAATPVAAISWGTTGRQRAVFGTLADIAAKVAAAGLRPPVTIVVGEVVSLGRQLCEAPRAPGRWRGKRVVVTRPVRPGDSLVAELEREEAEVVHLPLSTHAGPGGGAPVRRRKAAFPANGELREGASLLCDLMREDMVDVVLLDTGEALRCLVDELRRRGWSGEPREDLLGRAQVVFCGRPLRARELWERAALPGTTGLGWKNHAASP